jgi:predicted peptidase
MKLLSFVSGLIVAGCLGTALAAPVDSSLPPMQTAKQFTFTRKEKLNYLLFLPEGYRAKGEQSWPLLVFLHGAGERGSDLKKVAVHGPPMVAPRKKDFPFILVSPQCPEGQIWSRDVLTALVDRVIKDYRVDPSRVYLTGLSMGGYGTWDLGLANPDKFAALVPICGGGNLITALLTSPDKEAALKTLAVWAFHGAKDPVVPVSESERMVAVLKRRGVSEVKLTVYPEASHDAWTETYNNPELYSWLLQHRREPGTASLNSARKRE